MHIWCMAIWLHALFLHHVTTECVGLLIRLLCTYFQTIVHCHSESEVHPEAQSTTLVTFHWKKKHKSTITLSNSCRLSDGQALIKYREWVVYAARTKSESLVISSHTWIILSTHKCYCGSLALPHTSKSALHTQCVCCLDWLLIVNFNSAMDQKLFTS